MISTEELTILAQEHAQELGLIGLAERVSVLWNPRMRSTAGRAYYQKSQIELNPKLIDISEEELHRTFLHELAHLVAHARTFPRRIAPHGDEWHEACRDLGIPFEKVTHDLALPSHRQQRNWHYTCPHCKTVVTRARRMRRKWVACYPCCKAHNGGNYHVKFALKEEFVGPDK